MQREQSTSEKQLQSAGYVMRDTDLTIPGQPTTTFLDIQTAHYSAHTDLATREEETNHLDSPRTEDGGVGHNLPDVRRARPRAQSVTHSRVNQVFRQLGFSL
jgi:hypothetical protein